MVSTAKNAIGDQAADTVEATMADDVATTRAPMTAPPMLPRPPRMMIDSNSEIRS